MKHRSIHAWLFVLAAGSTLAQAPQAFNYQGVARDASGMPVANQPVGARYVLRSGAPLGPAVYEETHSTTTDPFGVFTLHVGEGTPVVGSFAAIDWSAGPYFLEVGLDLSSTGTFVSVGTQQLLSVPYALHAGSSGDLPHGTEQGQIMHWDGTEWVADSGLYVHVKRFGIGDTQPESPLGIKAEPGQDDRMISFHSQDASQKWNINLNPTGGDVDGFSIDDESTGTGNSRLYIASNTGNIGIGMTDPDAPLSIKSRTDLYEEFKNGDIPNENDFAFTTGGNDGFAIEEDTAGGLVSRMHIQSGTGHVGIGDDDPPAALSIESRDILKTYFQTGNIPTEQDFAIRTDSTGFDIGQGTPNSLASRFFIDHVSQGNIGIGTVQPQAKLHIESSTPAGITGIKLLNTASLGNQGWIIGDLHDDGVPERNKTFALHEKNGSELTERITVLSSGNVGISEILPDARLHVSRPASDPSSPVGLAHNTGILVVGPMTDNLVMDYEGIQARHTQFQGGGQGLNDYGVAQLGLQPLGGDILIHGEAALDERKVKFDTLGHVGLGTIVPTERLDVNGAIRIRDTDGNPFDGTIRYTGTDFEGRNGGAWVSMTQGNGPWSIGLNAIHYSGGNVGINEVLPTATLHVSRPTADPLSFLALAENTGILCLGPIEDNIVADHRGIQARHGEYVGGSPTLTFTASTLNLQRLGGDILIHGEDAQDERKIKFDTTGKVGLGTLTPLEKLHVNGAIVVGTTDNATPANGTIRWSTATNDLEGFAGGEWLPMSTWRRVVGSNDIHHNTRVGIGTSVIDSYLHLVDDGVTSYDRKAAIIHNHSSTSSTNADDHRVGLQIKNTGAWGGAPASKDVGLYVAQVTGQSSAEQNLAAVLNGNTVIGDLTPGSAVIGTGGTNVLAIQNGTPPSSAIGGGPGDMDNGIQLYSSSDVTGTSLLHVKLGNGDVIKLYRAPAITAPDNSAPGPGVDPSTALLIDNMRTRINELEQTLKALGLLTP